MTKMTDNQKRNIATGVAAGVGAVAGAASASFIPRDSEGVENQEADEAQVVGTEQPQPQASNDDHEEVYAQRASEESQPEVHAEVVDHVSDGPIHEPKPEPIHEDPIIEPDPDEPEPAPDIQVIDYDTVTLENGHQADIATLSVDGRGVVVEDTTMDGYANAIATDANGNGQIEDNEIHDVTGQGISMQPFKEEAGLIDNPNNPGVVHHSDPSGTLANLDGPDYINDGNVDNYLA